MLVVGCAGNTSSAEGDCARISAYEGRTYAGQGVRVAPREGDLIGKGVLLGCDDGGGRVPDEEIELAEIKGVLPKTAVAWHGDPSAVFVSESVDRLPPQLRQPLRAPKCDPRDEPIDLAGAWLGIVGTDGRGDPEPPFGLELLVQETTTPRYERAFLTVRVPEELGRPLTRSDIRSSLWEGGTIDLTVRCEDGRYVAERVSAHPPTS